MKRKYDAMDCIMAFGDCVEAGEKCGESDDFACDLHLEFCPDYERLTEIFDDPMYIGFLNLTKAQRRRFVQLCDQYIRSHDNA